MECDIADLASVRVVFQKALEVMGGQIHVLVNCAGIQRRSPSVDFSEQDWDDVRARSLDHFRPRFSFSAPCAFENSLVPPFGVA